MKKINNKVVLLGDTHFGARGDSISFQSHFKRFFDDVFFPYLIKHEIYHVIQAGDLFDRRKYINFQSLNMAKEMFFNKFKEYGIELHSFPGNHDIYFKNTLEINSLRELAIDKIENVNIYYEPTKINIGGVDIDVVPWIADDNKKESFEFIDKSASDICVGHFEFAGFEMMKGIESQSGLSVDDFSSYNTVYSGHYHHESKQGNVHYIGTPYEMTWNDYGDTKGFHVLDLRTQKSTKIINPYSMFHKIIYEDDMEIEYSKYADSIVKIVVDDKDAEKFDTFIDSLYDVNPIDVSIIDNSSVDEEDIDIDDIETEDTITTIMKNVDAINDNKVDRNEIKIIIQDVYNEAVELGRES